MTIRETIRLWQRTMAYYGREMYPVTMTYTVHQRPGKAPFMRFDDPLMPYPQSLGELCLDVCYEHRMKHGDGPHKGKPAPECLYRPRNLSRWKNIASCQVINAPFNEIASFSRALYYRPENHKEKA